jgi:hypothetical protein
MKDACAITEPTRAIAPPTTNSIGAGYAASRGVVSDALNCLARVSETPTTQWSNPPLG